MKTSEVRVDIILGLFPAPLEWRQTVKSSDKHGLGDLFCYYKFGEENEFDCCDLCEMPFRPLKQNFDLTHYWNYVIVVSCNCCWCPVSQLLGCCLDLVRQETHFWSCNREVAVRLLDLPFSSSLETPWLSPASFIRLFP